MKTIKELKEYFWDDKDPAIQSYYQWYKDAIELIFNDITTSETIKVKLIEKYLNDLMTK